MAVQVPIHSLDVDMGEELVKPLQAHQVEWKEDRETKLDGNAGSGTDKARELWAATTNYRSTVPDKALKFLWTKATWPYKPIRLYKAPKESLGNSWRDLEEAFAGHNLPFRPSLVFPSLTSMKRTTLMNSLQLSHSPQAFLKKLSEYALNGS